MQRKKITRWIPFNPSFTKENQMSSIVSGFTPGMALFVLRRNIFLKNLNTYFN